MTLEQLRIFVAVATREHMTRAAEALHITQSAVSGAIAALETQHQVRLFDRIGRRIELTAAGRMFLDEARGVLARADSARAALDDWAGLRRGRLALAASQTIAGYWLPERLARFRKAYPDIALSLSIANTEGCARATVAGEAELALVEGPVDDPVLEQWPIGTDRLQLIGPPGSADPEPVSNAWLRAAQWVVREPGSGTRASFDAGLSERGVDPAALDIVLTLPSNEAVLAAVRAGAGHAVLSRLVVAGAVGAGTVAARACDWPSRPFYAMRHKERHRGKAADALLALIEAWDAERDWVI